jgi:hypothetical protein
MLAKAWTIYDSITNGQRLADNIPESVIDDLPNDTHNYSFLDHGPFTTTPNALIRHLVDHHRLAAVDSEGRLSFNKPAIRQFFDQADELNVLLSILTFISCTVSTRITQFTDYTFRNANRRRNLHYLMNEMFLLAASSKMTGQTGFDLCIPNFYAREVQEIQMEVFGGRLRDCEKLFALVNYPVSSAEYYHTWVDLMSFSTVYSLFCITFKIYVGPEWEAGHA